MRKREKKKGNKEYDVRESDFTPLDIISVLGVIFFLLHGSATQPPPTVQEEAKLNSAGDWHGLGASRTLTLDPETHKVILSLPEPSKAKASEGEYQVNGIGVLSINASGLSGQINGEYQIIEMDNALFLVPYPAGSALFKDAFIQYQEPDYQEPNP